MNSYGLLLGLVPLILFVILDTFLSVKKALIFALLFASLEAAYTLSKFGEVDLVTGFSFLMLIILGATSFYKDDSIYFKFQPVLLSCFLGIYFFYTYCVGEPLFVVMVDKYHDLIPNGQKTLYQQPGVRILLKNFTLTSSVGFIFHGSVTALAALKLSNLWWLVCRGVGFYLIFFISFFVARFL